MSELFKFGGYSVRIATERDRGLLENWIAGDPDHRARGVMPEFFYTGEPGVGCYLLSDASGPLFFFKTANAVRVYAQFGPSETDEERERNRDALVESFDWLAAQCAAKGATEILFDTGNPTLERLALQRMGCDRAEVMVRDLVMERMGLGMASIACVGGDHVRT